LHDLDGFHPGLEDRDKIFTPIVLPSHKIHLMQEGVTQLKWVCP
jgi:hypothetical protein